MMIDNRSRNFTILDFDLTGTNEFITDLIEINKTRGVNCCGKKILIEQ